MARPRKPRPEKSASQPRDTRLALLMPMFAAGVPHADIVRQTGISLRTVQRYSTDQAVKVQLERLQEVAVKGTSEALIEARTVAIETLRKVMSDPDASGDARVRASIAVLDRTGYGPTSKQELTGKDGGAIEVVPAENRPRSLEEALVRIEALRERVMAGKTN